MRARNHPHFSHAERGAKQAEAARGGHVGGEEGEDPLNSGLLSRSRSLVVILRASFQLSFALTTIVHLFLLNRRLSDQTRYF